MSVCVLWRRFFVFFFQAEDGIRDKLVTGVQTCALPIYDWVSIGSSNLDRWSFRWNLEANQEIADARFADAAAALFERDFAASRALSRRHWRQRAWLDPPRAGLTGRVGSRLGPRRCCCGSPSAP